MKASNSDVGGGSCGPGEEKKKNANMTSGNTETSGGRGRWRQA